MMHRFWIVLMIIAHGVTQAASGQPCPGADLIATSNAPVSCELDQAFALDLDGDGIDEVALVSSTSTLLYLFRADGAGGLEPPQVLDLGVGVVQVTSGDFDEDGVSELLCGTNGPLVIRATADSSGVYSATQTFDTGSQQAVVSVGDLTGDGHLDFVVAALGGASSAVRLYSGDGLGGFAAPVELLPGSSANQVEISDIDSDGLYDLVVGVPAYLGGTPSLAVYLSLPSGGLAAPTVVTNQYDSGFVTGDVNSDGFVDFAVKQPQLTAACGGPIGVYLGSPAGSFTLGQSFAAGCGPFSPRIEDMNADGHDDLIYAYRSAPFDSTTTLEIAFGDGTGVLATPCAPLATPWPMSRFAVGEWNGDLYRDVVAPPGCTVGFPSPPGITGSLTVFLSRSPIPFERGDCNDDGLVNIADAVWLLALLFPLGPTTTAACAAACDGNDDDAVNIADAITILNTLFIASTPPLPAPSGQCATDRTPGATHCSVSLQCP
ncbi:MAG: FG-GAP-like repeat-containing protein [Planctomycetota bacterium]